MGTIRPGGGAYCPPVLLISQVTHRGGLFWLLAAIRRVVKAGPPWSGHYPPYPEEWNQSNHTFFFCFFFLLHGFWQMSVVAHQNSFFWSTSTFSFHICVNNRSLAIHEFISSRVLPSKVGWKVENLHQLRSCSCYNSPGAHLDQPSLKINWNTEFSVHRKGLCCFYLPFMTRPLTAALLMASALL